MFLIDVTPGILSGRIDLQPTVKERRVFSSFLDARQKARQRQPKFRCADGNSRNNISIGSSSFERL